MYSTASVYRSSWLIISCFLFLTQATSCLELHKFWPNKAQLTYSSFFTIQTKMTSSYFYLDKNPDVLNTTHCEKMRILFSTAENKVLGFFPACLPRNGKERLSALWWNFSLLTTNHSHRKRPTSELMSNSCAPRRMLPGECPQHCSLSRAWTPEVELR